MTIEIMMIYQQKWWFSMIVMLVYQRVVSPLLRSSFGTSWGAAMCPNIWLKPWQIPRNPPGRPRLARYEARPPKYEELWIIYGWLHGFYDILYIYIWMICGWFMDNSGSVDDLSWMIFDVWLPPAPKSLPQGATGRFAGHCRAAGWCGGGGGPGLRHDPSD